jgi:uncharacterized membrane protein YcaP (DUF421 family)
MSILSGIDWREMWVPSKPLFEVVIRGTVIYLFLVVLFRIVRRDAGNLSLADLLVVVLIADASQNALAGEYHSLTEGLLLVGTIVFWSYLLDWLAYHVRWIDRLLEPRPLPLVRDGVMQRRNMRRELITPDELKSQLRQKGVVQIEDVRRCYLEPDGQISVVPASRRRAQPDPKKEP